MSDNQNIVYYRSITTLYENMGPTKNRTRTIHGTLNCDITPLLKLLNNNNHIYTRQCLPYKIQITKIQTIYKLLNSTRQDNLDCSIASHFMTSVIRFMEVLSSLVEFTYFSTVPMILLCLIQASMLVDEGVYLYTFLCS